MWAVSSKAPGVLGSQGKTLDELNENIQGRLRADGLNRDPATGPFHRPAIAGGTGGMRRQVFILAS